MSATKSSLFQPVEEKGWKRGLGNLLQGEYSVWFKSSKWWKQLILWFSIINLMMVAMVYANDQAGGDGPDVLFMYGIFGGMFVAFGVMIIMQRTIIGEKRSGTAAADRIASRPSSNPCASRGYRRHGKDAEGRRALLCAAASEF